jgi:hypothetical protein
MLKFDEVQFNRFCRMKNLTNVSENTEDVRTHMLSGIYSPSCGNVVDSKQGTLKCEN